MTDLNLERPGDHLYIRAVGAEGVQIADRWYRESLVIGRTGLAHHWPPRRVEDLEPAHLDAVFAMEPEVVLIGTGARQCFLRPELSEAFFERGLGAEVMSTAAACRTFNVLVGEGRRVVAGLILAVD